MPRAPISPLFPYTTPSDLGHVEHRGRLIARSGTVALDAVALRLLDLQRERMRARVVRRGDGEGGVTGAVDPLAPEPLQVLAGGCEHRLAQIVRGRVAERVAREIGVEGSPEALG